MEKNLSLLKRIFKKTRKKKNVGVEEGIGTVYS